MHALRKEMITFLATPRFIIQSIQLFTSDVNHHFFCGARAHMLTKALPALPPQLGDDGSANNNFRVF